MNDILRLKLLRVRLEEDYTEGILICENDNSIICDTLEDKVRDVNGNGVFDGDEKKVYGETAIPYGMYDIEVTYSPKFKRDMVLIKDVSEFKGVRMHWGRTAKNSLGCVLVGKKYEDGKLENIGMTDKLVKLLKSHGNKGVLDIQ